MYGGIRLTMFITCVKSATKIWRTMDRQGIEEKGLEVGQYEYIAMTESEGKVITYHN